MRTPTLSKASGNGYKPLLRGDRIAIKPLYKHFTLSVLFLALNLYVGWLSG
jgi:hypothetical protein